MIRIDNMFPDVILDDLCHEAVHCAARSDDEMKDIGAALFFLDRAFERLHLAENPSHSVQKLGFLFDRMSHLEQVPPYPRGYSIHRNVRWCTAE